MSDTITLPSTDSLRDRARISLRRLGTTVPAGDGLAARSPITGEDLFGLQATTPQEAEQAIAAAAFQDWRTTPPPARGELVRRLGDLIREHKTDLADLITIEAGKIRSEALGEVQEMIDICDFALGCPASSTAAPSPRNDQGTGSQRPGTRLASWA